MREELHSHPLSDAVQFISTFFLSLLFQPLHDLMIYDVFDTLANLDTSSVAHIDSAWCMQALKMTDFAYAALQRHPDATTCREKKTNKVKTK